MAVNYSKYTTKQLEAMKQANSSDWHTAGSQQERDALHNANVEINKILDSRKGTTSTFDSGTGKWTSSGGSSGSKGSSSSGGSGSRGSSSSSSGSSGGSTTPDYLKGLTGGTGAGNNAWVSGVDDNGEIDYSVMLNDLLGKQINYGDIGQMQQAYYDVLNAQKERNKKITDNPDLAQYANAGGINDRVSEYLQNLASQIAQTQRQNAYMDQINSIIGERPVYEKSDWDETKEALAKAALEMNYADWAKSDQYAALADRYGQQGEMSMRDVLGQIANRTGGLASSYATTAAQQQYNQYMSQLEQAAREMYAGERSDALQNAQLAGEFSDRDYNRYLEQLAQYNRDRSFGFDLLSQVLQDSRYNQEWQNTLDQQEYQRQQDALKNSWYEQEYADSMEDREYKRKLEQAKLLADTTGDYSGYLDLGYSQERVAQMQQGAQQQAASGYTGGGGRSGSGGGSDDGDGDYDGLFRAAQQSGYPASFISNHFKDYGFTSKTGLEKGYDTWMLNEGYQYSITDISQVGQTAKNILNSASRSSSGPASIAEKVESALKNGSITKAEAAFILRSIGY